MAVCDRLCRYAMSRNMCTCRCALPCVADVVYFVPDIPCTVYMYMCGVTGKMPMPLYKP